MKKIRVVLISIVCIGLIVGGYFLLTSKNKQSSTEDVELTEVQQVITKDLDKKYPETPREVVKFFNRITTCYYNEEYTEEELYGLVDQARALFDDELAENNPRKEYAQSVQTDVAEYHEANRTIASTSVSSSNDVEYRTVDGDECAYVNVSYFIKEGKSYNRTYQTFVLRKDEDGKWKILVFYQVEGESSENE